MTTAWVLRGGASFGAAQVGMARALLEAGHHPDMLYGASAGALNAAWLANNPTVSGLDDLGRLWATVSRRNVFPVRPWALLPGLAGWQDHIISPAPLARWLRSVNKLRRLQDGALPLTVVATDLESGGEALLQAGPALPALMASIAMPGIFPPVEIEGRWLIDGSIALDTAIGPAVAAGATRAWVLQSVPSTTMKRPRAALDVLLRSSSIILSRQHDDRVDIWSRQCELYVVPAPMVPGVSPFDFRHSQDLIDAAYRLTKEWLPTAKPVSAGAERYLRG